MVPPPPVNASNLNDISNALQAVNITQQERTALGAQANDTLGQVLEMLKTKIDNTQSGLQQKGNCQIMSGSYVGNGQLKTISLTFGFEPDMVFIIPSGRSGFLHPKSNAPWCFTTRSAIIWHRRIGQYITYSTTDTLGDYYISLRFSFSNNTLSYSCEAGSELNASSIDNYNENGITYKWIALKSI